jgi:hypothetical protein
MENKIKIIVLFLVSSILVNAQDKSSSNIKQSFSGKFGFYNPDERLNNGLLFGVDGITEFTNYNFLLSGAIDLYYKKTIDLFDSPKPAIQDQSIILIPLHANAGYKLADITDADTRIYAGLGAGYYLYFYDVNYSEGGLLGGLTRSASKNSGNFVFTLFTRFLIGKIFIEPRFYFATAGKESIENYNLTIDPSGFAITLGFQY